MYGYNAQVVSDKNKNYVLKYSEQAKLKNELERTDLNKDKSGVFSGAYAINPLTNKKIPCGIVNSLREALDDVQVKDRNIILEVDHPVFGTVKQVRTAAHVGDSRNAVHKRAPFLNENKDYILKDILKYGSDRITYLEKGGALG